MEKEADNRLALAVWSCVSCLVSELSKAGVIDPAKVIGSMQLTVAEKRAAGDPQGNADMMHALTEHLLITVRDQQAASPPARDN